MSLKNKLIRLAYNNPDLRADLLPLLKEASKKWWEQEERDLYKSVVPLLEKAVKGIRGVKTTEKEWENAVGVSFLYEPTGFYYYLWIPTPSYDTDFNRCHLQYGSEPGDLTMNNDFVGPNIQRLTGDWKKDQRTIIDWATKSLKQKHTL